MVDKAEIQVPLQGPVNSNGHLESGRHPAHNYYKKHRITLGLMVLVPIIIVSAVLTVLAAKPPSAAPGPPAVPCCPDSWIGYQQKCYYFSEEEGNWTYSRNHCSALGASLAGIDTLQDLAFLLRHKGTCDHWVGLRREWNQPWKWANGTEFDHCTEKRRVCCTLLLWGCESGCSALQPVTWERLPWLRPALPLRDSAPWLLHCRFAIRGGGDCAYLNDKDRVRSSRCYSERRWVCSKPAGYTMGTDPALGRGSH
ncbi:C-type lectin domain family 2 member A-like isoform X2 [Carettochelys insculpta]|uniref:C-type lectin domain family 2 member A-like isoform X2 n=1 Tax=Carettochelys insculpta TaxID=44489 RepID=UPI003EBF9C08